MQAHVPLLALFDTNHAARSPFGKRPRRQQPVAVRVKVARDLHVMCGRAEVVRHVPRSQKFAFFK